MSHTGMQSCSMLEGVTDTCRNGPLGISVEQAGENATRLAVLPGIAACLSKGASAPHKQGPLRLHKK